MTQQNDRDVTSVPKPAASDAVDVDDARDRISDYLFRTKAMHPRDDIAANIGCDIATMRTAVDHEWFRVADDRVSIAYVVAGVPHLTRP
jgi:hypothetical protein